METIQYIANVRRAEEYLYRSVALAARRVIPRDKNYRHPLDRRLGGTLIRTRHWSEDTISCPYQEFNPDP